MPDYLREEFAIKYQSYLDNAEKGAKIPSKKQIRLMATFKAILHTFGRLLVVKEIPDNELLLTILPE